MVVKPPYTPESGDLPAIISFSDHTHMAERVGDVIENAVSLAVSTRGCASLALSGGSTPAALYDSLAHRDLRWDCIQTALVDERWVKPDADGSNEQFIRNCLDKDGHTPKVITSLYTETPTPHEGLEEIEGRLQKLQTPFDVVVLGMGNDGHTASWFPHAEGLDDALSSPQLVSAILAQKSEITGDHLYRMTMTLSAIRSARHIIMLITGEQKRDTLEKARTKGAIEDMPVRAIFGARPDMWVCWAP